MKTNLHENPLYMNVQYVFPICLHVIQQQTSRPQ